MSFRIIAYELVKNSLVRKLISVKKYVLLLIFYKILFVFVTKLIVFTNMFFKVTLYSCF